MKHSTVWLIILLLSGCCLSGYAQDDKDWQKEARKREHESEKDRAEREREYSKKEAEKQRERLKDQRENEKENDKKEHKKEDDDEKHEKSEKYPDRYTPSMSEAKRNPNPPTPRSTRRPMPTW